MTSESKPVICVRSGTLGIDIDALADHLGMTSRELKNSMQLLALNYMVNEAERLNSGEHFQKKTKIFPYPPIMDRHVISAAKSMLKPTTETKE